MENLTLKSEHCNQANIYQKIVAVVVPMYKQELSLPERISLAQIFRILHPYDIYLVIPETLRNTIQSNFAKISFPDDYFQDILSYNRLMVTEEFYKRFIDYQYVLVCQLDVFIFSDKLLSFCALDFDYIGAPWIRGVFHYKDEKHAIWNVGNGGLSLRKVTSFLNITRKRKSEFDANIINEDIFFSIQNDNTFKVADEKTALRFSFEMDVQECYRRNNCSLPFGCHAWYKYDVIFLKKYIEAYGYALDRDLVENGQEDYKYQKLKRRDERFNLFWNSIPLRRGVIDEIEDQIGKTIGNFTIWGAGYWGNVLCGILLDSNNDIITIIDKKKELDNRFMYGKKIVSPREWKEERQSDSFVIVAMEKVDKEIIDFLENEGLRYKRQYILLKDIRILWDKVVADSN